MTTGLRIAIEGNIGVGKSTLLPRLKEVLPGDWDVLSERVDEDPEFKALLADFYQDPNKQAQLQSWITHRRLREFQALSGNPQHYLFERSFLGEIVFCHANFLRHEKPEGTFVSFYYNIMNALKQCRYDAVIYLKATPESCYERIRYRSRAAENTISYDYVRFLHACYEAHLPETARSFNIPVLTVDWSNFGSVDEIGKRLSAMLDVAQPAAKSILV